MKRQKGISTTLSVLLITLLIAAIGGIIIYKYISAPTEKPSNNSALTEEPSDNGEPEESQDETTDWDTYRNEKYGFEIKYPKEWHQDKKESSYLYEKVFDIIRFSPNEEFLDWSGKEGLITIDIISDFEEDLQIWFNKLSAPCMECAPFPPSFDSYTTIDGEPAIKAIEGLPGTAGHIDVFCTKDNIRYDFTLALPDTGDESLINDHKNIFNQMLSTFRFLESLGEIETKEWKDYLLEEISQEWQSPSFYDRRLVGIRDNGQRDIIISSIKETLGESKDDITWYPEKVSFPPYSPKIFFVKRLSETAHSIGLIMFDVENLTFEELAETGEIYQNYYNYESIISPDGLKIASLGYENLYLLNLIDDKVELLAKAKAGEIFYRAQKISDFVWRDNYHIMYPIYSEEKVGDPPIGIRLISIKETERMTEDEIVDWETYRNENYGFEFKYPKDSELLETFLNSDMPLYYGVVPPEQQFSPIEVIIHKKFDESYIKEYYPEFYSGTGESYNLIVMTTSEISEKFNQDFRGNLAPYNQAPLEEIEIGGEEALKYHVDSAPGSSILIWLLKDGKGTGFMYSYSSFCDFVVDQILSTFKFLE